MATIKDRVFNPDAANKVCSDYWNANKRRFSIKKGDIIIARSGEGTIGKAAIIKDDFDAIFCDFTMRVRVAGYNPFFLCYYINTEMFQSLIERDKKGLGNNTNIFPSQIKEFPIPDISLPRQDFITEKIDAIFTAQRAIDVEIDAKRKKIERLVLAATE